MNCLLSGKLDTCLLLLCGLFLLAPPARCQSATAAPGNTYPSRDNIAWNTPGSSENDSMPVGNGDLAANVWTEQNGDVVLLVAKSDAWSELNKLDKLARIRIHFAENPFAGAEDFSQTLHVENASVEIRGKGNRLSIWADANQPVLHLSGHLARPAQVEARVELWRTRTHNYSDPSPDRGGMFGLEGFAPTPPALPVAFAADTVLPAEGSRLLWYHLNPDSIYPVVLQEQHLESLRGKYPDPLLGRCFGALLQAKGMSAADDRTLRSATPLQDLDLALVALTTTAPETAKSWQQKIEALSRSALAVPEPQAWREHQVWWTNFWNRSWIQLDGPAEAHAVEQGYVMQRYMMAASSRGAFPVKFNGGLFTVGGNVPQGAFSTEAVHNPDYRKWGGSYWNQNNRHLYWPLLASGDYDLVKPWFDMYLRALPLAKDRTQTYFHHDGAIFIETIDFWGLPNLNDFGWNHPDNELASPWMRYHTQGSLEVIAQMLDEYEITEDMEFAKKDLVPFADAILTYYAQHWPVGEDGKIRFYPSQSIETYQVDATNPTPDIAGIDSVAHRLLQLPEGLSTVEERASWRRLLQKLPPLAMGRTHEGKIPPSGPGDADGKQVVLPAQTYGRTKNVENPELYTVFPYRIYGVGKPNLELARETYEARLFPFNYCWGQDGEEAALLGLTEEARKAAVRALTNYGKQRFGWFWEAANDWIPDLDNGGAGMTTLQYMLLQTDGKRIQLLPAWPKDWNADFKLHAAYQTVVEGRVENGHIAHLKVTPELRKNDVVIAGEIESK